MSTGTNGEQSTNGPTVLHDYGPAISHDATNRKGATEVKVRVCEGAGAMPMVDVRTFITSTCKGPKDGYAGKGKDRVQYKRSTYVGPTKQGLWLSPLEAEALIEVLAAAVVDAQSRELELSEGEVA